MKTDILYKNNLKEIIMPNANDDILMALAFFVIVALLLVIFIIYTSDEDQGVIAGPTITLLVFGFLCVLWKYNIFIVFGVIAAFLALGVILYVSIETTQKILGKIKRQIKTRKISAN